MKQQTLIGISGKIGSGKDTIGGLIQCLTSDPLESFINIDKFMEVVKQTGMIPFSGMRSRWEIKKYAGKLKQVVSILTGIPVEDLEKESVKDTILPNDWKIIEEANTVQLIRNYEEPGKDPLENAYEMGWRPDAELVEPETGWKREKSHYTVRKLLQIVGTEAGRKVIHPNLWVIALFADYKPLNEELRASIGNVLDYSDCDFPSWIITDVRFDNEVEAIKKRGGIVIRVERPIEKRFPDLWDNYVYLDKTGRPTEEGFMDWLKSIHRKTYDKLTHESETALDNYNKFDYTLHNLADLNRLQVEVQHFLDVKGLNPPTIQQQITN
jgi:hypothetical protein